MGYPVQAIHVPKTVDNDPPITDNCPVSVRSRSTSPCRHWRPASTYGRWPRPRPRSSSSRSWGGTPAGSPPPARLSRTKASRSSPVPEVEFDSDKFLANVDAKVREHGLHHLSFSEGCHWPDGKFLAEQGTRDAFGHAQLGGAAPVVANMIKDALGYKFHWAVADYLQRAARHLASQSDVEQAYALGKAAVEKAPRGQELDHADRGAHLEPAPTSGKSAKRH